MIHSLRCAWLLLFVLLTAGSASAQKDYTYTPQGTVTFKSRFGDLKQQIVSITNETNSPTFLKIKFFGDTSFKFSHSQSEYLYIGADSTANFTVSYLASRFDTSIGWLRMYDSVNTPDTIRFVGMDTNYIEPPPPAKWKVDTTGSRFVGGSYYGLPDTMSVRVRNLTANPIYVTGSIIEGAMAYVGGLETREVPANGTTDFVYWFNSSVYDSLYARIRLHDDYRSDTVKIYSRREWTWPTGDSLDWYWRADFDTVLPRDTVCRTVQIVNHFDSTAQILSLEFYQDGRPYFISDPPTLPYSIAGGDTLDLVICVAPIQVRRELNSALMIEYQFPGNQPRMRQVFLTGMSGECLHPSPDWTNFGAIQRGTSATRTFYLVNNRPESIHVDSLLLYGDSSADLMITSATSFVVSGHDSVGVEIRYTPTDDSVQLGYLDVFSHDGCIPFVRTYIYGTTYGDGSNYQHRLYGDTTNTLVFTGDTTLSTTYFLFINDLTDSLKVLSVGLQNGTHFQVHSISPHAPELDLGPGDLIGITLQFIGPPGTFEDTLLIVTETGIIALRFPIIADVHHTSGVAVHIRNATQLIIQPNPATGPVHVELLNARSATIDVLDVLGKLAARLEQSSMWDHSSAASGTYFIRASGISNDGQPFVITSRVIVQ